MIKMLIISTIMVFSGYYFNEYQNSKKCLIQNATFSNLSIQSDIPCFIRNSDIIGK